MVWFLFIRLGEKMTCKFPTCVEDIVSKIDLEKENKLVGVNVDGEFKNLKYVIPYHNASIEPGIIINFTLFFG